MPTDAEYESMIAQFDNWKKLRTFWRKIRKGDTPGWSSGKAFEYLVLQAFQLDGGVVRWPYRVEIGNEVVDGKNVNALITELGQVSPRRALQKLDPDLDCEHIRFKILRAIDEEDIKALRSTVLIKELLGFLREAVEYSKRSAVSRV